MSWSQRQEQQSNVLVTAQTLEERINMYISAMDSATAMNNGNQSSQLQQDIQTLVDLMERISAGQAVMEQEVPPPLMINSQTDVLANPLGELSARLSEYHKALYFAEEELSEDRMNKIQRLQRGLQTIHELQKRAQAGFPVRVDEIPPPMAIPSDDEFDPDALNTLTSRLDSFKAALSFASQSDSDKRRIPKLQNAIRSVEFLLTRAKAKRPIWKKDIPPEYEYCVLDSAQSESQPVNKAKLTLQLRSLQKRVQDIIFKKKDQQKHLDTLKKKLQNLEAELSGKQASAELESRLKIFSKEVENLETMAFAEKTKEISNGQENLDLIEVRINEYKAAALACKRDGQLSHAIQHFKIIKGLLALKDAFEKGELVDMTLVPPPPREFTPTSESHPPLTEFSQGMVQPETAHNAVGATAQLTPVIIKPAVESAEDKLAKKLSSYLDKGVDLNLSTSKQMLNIHNISVSTAQCLPKIQNTETRNENVFHTYINNVASSNIDSEMNETDPLTVNIENHLKEVRDESLLECRESTTVQPFSSYADGQVEEKDCNGVSENEPFSMTDNEQGQESSENEEHFKDQNKNETTSNISTPNSSPSKSADIYSRKTLDSVGFLSCQVVPDHSVRSKVAVASRDSMTLVSSDTPSELDTLEQQRQSVDVNITSEDHVDLASHDLIIPSIQPDSHTTTAGTVSSLINDTQSEALPVAQSSNTETLHSPQDARNDYSSSCPSSITMPIHSSEIYSSNINSEPSSLPISLTPKVFEVHESSDKDIIHSLPINHTPDIKRLAMSVADSNISPINVSIRDFSLQLSNRKGQERDLTSIEEVNSRLNDFSNSEAADSKQEESNGRTSPDALEFQDLIDSMAMPSIAAPASLTSINSSVVKLSSHQNEQLESSVPHLNQSVLSEQNASLSDITANSGSFVSSHQASCQENNDSVIPPVVSYTLPFVEELNRENTYNTANSSLSFAPKDVCISTDVSQDNTSSSTSVSDLPDHHRHTSDNNTTPLGSKVLAQKPMNISNGSLFTMPAANPQLQSLQSNGMAQTSSTHSQSLPELAKLKSASTSRPSSVFAYSDVAFTCLENLKYDCLLSLAKGTDESKQEEKKLRAKFELIKGKLHNGGKRTWEVYKACVQREHASIIQQIEDLCLLQQWSDVQLLSEKKSIAERELLILSERLPELKY